MKALVLLAEGFEELEAVTIIDVLRRAGITVITAGMGSVFVKGSHDIKVACDADLMDIDADAFYALIMPGGPGHKKLIESSTVVNLIKEFDNKNKIIGAICAAPAVLGRAGILENRKATIYPGMKKAIPRPSSERLVVDKNIITSQGPGTAMMFALALVEKMAGKRTVNRLKEEMII